MTQRKILPLELRVEDAKKAGFIPVSTEPPIFWAYISRDVEFVYRLDDRNMLCYFDKIPLKREGK